MPRKDSQKASTEQGAARGRWADLWLVPGGESLRGLVEDIREAIETNENRRRKRKARDEETFRATLDSLIANLALATLLGEAGGAVPETAICLGKAMRPGMARYGHPLIPAKTLTELVRGGEVLGLLHLSPGYRGRASTIRPTDAFRRDLVKRGVSLQDIGRSEVGEEVIILSQKQRGDDFRDSPSVARVGYCDTPDTHAMRRDVLALNTQMARLDLAFIPDGLPPPDLTQRRIRRHFTLPPGSTPSPATSLATSPTTSPLSASPWINGGRLFGGFWMNISKDRRRASLRIDGEPIAEADYSAMFIRLAYCQMGAELPAGLQDDPYAIQGWPEGYRAGLKAALNAMLFANGPLLRLPPDIAPGVPAGWTARDIREAIVAAHPALGMVLGTRIGFRLMRVESDILLAVMARCAEAGIPALPLHDAVLVPESRGKETRQMMELVGEEVSGVRLKVELKG